MATYTVSTYLDHSWTATGAGNTLWDNDTYITNYKHLIVGDDATWTRDATFRFLNVAIPQGATIDSASISVVGYNVGTLSATIRGRDEDNTSRITNYASFYARSTTSASVSWSTALAAGVTVTSGDIKSIVQEIVDRASWSSGNALGFFLLGGAGWGRFRSDRHITAPQGMTFNVTYTSYADIGIRVGAIKVGTLAVGSNALRIRKSGTTYGIPLIATNDASACGIRIYDGASVKSVPEVA